MLFRSKVAWSPAAAVREILAADLSLIPCLDSPAARAKSNNRLTVLMGAGLPVIATPIPAYRAIVEPGVTGCLAEGTEEWASSLRALRDPALRRRMGEAARTAAWERYAPNVVADRWEALLQEIVDRRERVERREVEAAANPQGAQTLRARGGNRLEVPRQIDGVLDHDDPGLAERHKEPRQLGRGDNDNVREGVHRALARIRLQEDDPSAHAAGEAGEASGA